MTLPLIKLRSLADELAAGNSDNGVCVVKELMQALNGQGFLYLVEHDIPDEVFTKLLGFSKAFFALPQATKDQIAMSRAGRAWRGYFRLGAELTMGRPDYKEGLYFGPEHDEHHPGVRAGWPTFGHNLWPSGAAWPGFAAAVTAYMSHARRVGETLLAAIARGLGLEATYFQERFSSEPTEFFRIFHYPQMAAAAETFGVAEHTDMGFLTMLWQDQEGGLQIKGSSGQWLEAPPVAGSLIINIGDMLEYWTGGLLRATPHRVINRHALNRYSFPYFLDPNWQAPLGRIPPAILKPCVPLTVAAGGQRWDKLDLNSLEQGLTYGAFVWDKIRTVFPQLEST